MNIYQRVNQVRQKVAYLRKEKQADSYMVVTHDQVTGELRDSFIEFGIVTPPPSVIKGVSLPTGTMTRSQVPYIRYEATYRVAFVNMDDPADRIESDVEVHAIDHGDKAPGKAMSYAMKAAMLKLFNIETGEQEEEREDAKAQTVSEEQQLKLHVFCEEHGLPPEATLKAMATKAFNLKEIKELPAKRFDEAMELLKLKLKAVEKEAKNGAAV